MGMRIGGAGSSGAMQSSGAVNWQQRQQNFKDLFSALQAGDQAGAQKAYAALTGNAGSPNANGLLAQIGQALQNGDLAEAQKAAQAFQASRSGHHHHRQEGQQTDVQAPETSTPNPAATGPGSLINLTA